MCNIVSIKPKSHIDLFNEFMQVECSRSMGGLNELIADMLHNENTGTSYDDLKQLLHRIEDDATEIYHTKYDSDDTMIKFNMDSNSDSDSDIALLGRQSAKSLECIRKSIKKNLYLMQEGVRKEFEAYLALCGEEVSPV